MVFGIPSSDFETPLLILGVVHSGNPNSAQFQYSKGKKVAYTDFQMSLENLTRIWTF